MAEGTITVELCAPERDPIEFTVREAMFPGAGGVFTVRPGHTSLLTTLIAGVVVLKVDGNEDQYFAVSDGFAEVRGDRVRVLSSVFESGQDVDVTRAQAAQERAESRLRKPGEDTDLARAELAIHRAMARLQASKRQGY